MRRAFAPRNSSRSPKGKVAIIGNFRNDPRFYVRRVKVQGARSKPPWAVSDSIAARRSFMNQRDPNGYWSGSEAREAQYIYVAFCELASAILDYCEGTTMRQPLSPDSHSWERKGYTRQNWGGTILYYSLVHTARLLVFLSCGDFPTSHNSLLKCFNPLEKPVSTDWLKKFLSVDDDNTKQSCKNVSFGELVEYWSSRPNANRDVVSEYLAHLGKLLAQAKNLRNDNNYEALLIAHEYRHDLGQSFESLSSSMDSAALFALRIACEWLNDALNVGGLPPAWGGRVTTLQELASLNNFALYPSITPRWAASIRVE